MSRSKRPGIRTADIKNMLAALKEAGLVPTAIDALPDGTQRFHFTPPSLGDENDLDSDFDVIEARNGLR
jgi:hypothetical protein